MVLHVERVEEERRNRGGDRRHAADRVEAPAPHGGTFARQRFAPIELGSYGVDEIGEEGVVFPARAPADEIDHLHIGQDERRGDLVGADRNENAALVGARGFVPHAAARRACARVRPQEDDAARLFDRCFALGARLIAALAIQPDAQARAHGPRGQHRHQQQRRRRHQQQLQRRPPGTAGVAQPVAKRDQQYKAKRIQESTKDVVKTGGVPNYVNYVMPYRLMEYDKGFLLFAEVYSPSSSFSNYPGPYGPNYYNPYYSPYGWYYPGFGRMYSRPYNYGNTRSIDEIKTYESVLVSFDANGNVQWDHSLALDEMKRSSMEQVTDFALINNQIVFAYKKESEIKVKSIVLETNDSEEATEKIKTLYPEDEIRSEKEDEGGTIYWYGNAFYVWGYQTIRNNTKEDKSRDVFYINKLEFK